MSYVFIMYSSLKMDSGAIDYGGRVELLTAHAQAQLFGGNSPASSSVQLPAQQRLKDQEHLIRMQASC